MLGKKGISLILAISMTFTVLGSINAKALDKTSNNNESNSTIVEEEIETSNIDEKILENEDEVVLEKEEAIENQTSEDLPSNYNDYDSLERETPITYSVAEKEIKDVNIISSTPVTPEQAKSWARSKGASEVFIGLADLFWKYAPSNGNVNPGIAYVQSAKETGYGNFGGVLDASYYNTCGLKTSGGGGDYDPNAHQRFENWDQGVQAHLDHLALYAGATGYPRKNTYDPRHFASITGKAKTAYALGGNWAPSPTYGNSVAGLYADMMKFAGHSNEEDTTNPSDKGWVKENGSWYYLDSDGNKCTDWLKDRGSWYFLNSEGQMLTGWQLIKGSYYYLGSDGKMAKGIINDGYDDYLLDPEVGNLKYGWQVYNGHYYFLDLKSGVMKKGWYHDGYDWYYLKNDGKMAKGKMNDGYDDYFFDKNTGVMAQGWHFDGSNYYFTDKNTGVMKKGWIHDGYDWYYMDPTSGVMKTGLLKVDNEEYLLKSSGVMAQGWQFVNKNWHYFKTNGKMAKNTYVDGYYINYDGVYRSKKLIVIDPGHSKTGDRGSSAVYNGTRYYEGDVNMQVASKLQQELINRGYDVFMIRDENNTRNISLQERTKIANEKRADLFISVHHDSGPTSAAGVTSFYSSYKPNVDKDDIVEVAGWGGTIKADKTPSEQAKFAKVFSDDTVKDLASGNSFANRKSHDRNLYVTRETIMPAILVECGFLTNESELQRIINPTVQTNTAKIIANSVEDLY